MSLLDEALTKKPAQKCKIALALESNVVTSDELEKAFAADVPATWLEAAFKDRGFPISEKTIRKHQQGNCGYCNR